MHVYIVVVYTCVETREKLICHSQKVSTLFLKSNVSHEPGWWTQKDCLALPPQCWDSKCPMSSNTRPGWWTHRNLPVSVQLPSIEITNVWPCLAFLLALFWSGSSSYEWLTSTLLTELSPQPALILLYKETWCISNLKNIEVVQRNFWLSLFLMCQFINRQEPTSQATKTRTEIPVAERIDIDFYFALFYCFLSPFPCL